MVVTPDIYNPPIIGYFPSLLELEDGTPCLARVAKAAAAQVKPAPAQLSKPQKEDVRALEDMLDIEADSADMFGFE